MVTAQQIGRFIEEIAPLIQAEAKKRGYKVASPIIAQACIESAFGTSSLGYKYHNYFGMKCGSGWKGKSVNLRTKEEYKVGVLTTIKDNFRVYGSMAEGVAGYFDFINMKRYENLKTAKTAKEYLEMIKADGYATSSTYVNTNMNCIRTYNLTKYDTIGESFKSITPELIKKVIMGEYGDGQIRSLALTGDGYNAEDVQKKINELYKLSKELEPIKKKAGEYFDCVLML